MGGVKEKIAMCIEFLIYKIHEQTLQWWQGGKKSRSGVCGWKLGMMELFCNIDGGVAIIGGAMTKIKRKV